MVLDKTEWFDKNGQHTILIAEYDIGKYAITYSTFKFHSIRFNIKEKRIGYNIKDNRLHALFLKTAICTYIHTLTHTLINVYRQIKTQ